VPGSLCKALNTHSFSSLTEIFPFLKNVRNTLIFQEISTSPEKRVNATMGR
jgi:hypothetical protein